MKLSLRQ